MDELQNHFDLTDVELGIIYKYRPLRLIYDIKVKYPFVWFDVCSHFFSTENGLTVIKGFKVWFNDNLYLSIQFGSGSFTSNQEKLNKYLLPSSIPQLKQDTFLSVAVDYEIAIIKNDMFYVFDDGTSVLGWLDSEMVMNIIDETIIGKGLFVR